MTTIKLNDRQLVRFIDKFQIKAKTVLIKPKGNRSTIIINGVIIFDVNYDMIKEYI